MPLSERELSAISITEHVCSAISLIGAGIVVTTFIASPSFRKPLNRLIFFASWGNMMANLGTLIARASLAYSETSFICQFQGLLIQWFFPADALWAFCMACNVYLTIFHRYGPNQLRRLEWRYALCCYGVPFIPAFVLIFIQTEEKGRVYGSAIIWCWISLPWQALRIGLLYGPVWLVILLTFGIYIRAGRHIYLQMKQVRDLDVVEDWSEHDTHTPTAGDRGMPMMTHPRWPSSDSQRNVIGQETLYPQMINSHSTSAGSRHRERLGSDSGIAAWAYSKYALLFFVALLVTWVPSTINRLYSLWNPNSTVFVFNYLSAFVIPLQGFWNSMIYIYISRPAFGEIFEKIWGRHMSRRTRSVPLLHSRASQSPDVVRRSKRRSLVLMRDRAHGIV